MTTKFTVKPRVKWLPQGETDKLADQLVEAYSSPSEDDIKELKELINDYSSGAATYKGYQIYVKNLLGSMSSICPELVDAICKDNTTKPVKRSFRD